MRVTAGDLRGRVVRVPDLPGLRPTPSKVRQALFNILGPIDGESVLDLFAGTGIMSLEALSRGAVSALSIELNRKLTVQMQQLRGEWQLGGAWQIVAAPVEAGLKGLAGRQFDLVFADPPYRQGFSEQLPAWLDRHGIDCDRLVIEEASDVSPVWPAGWECSQSRRYGDTTLHFLLRRL